jgi:hypothetical protein
LTPQKDLIMTAEELRSRASERRRVGWELSDAMTPDEMEAIAYALERMQEQIRGIPLLIGQIVLAVGGRVRVLNSQMIGVEVVSVSRHDDTITGDAIFTATVT